MLFDSTILARVAADVRHTAIGARVQRVFAPDKTAIALDLRRKLPRPQVVLSWSAEFGRVHMCGDAEPKPDLNLSIADVLRKHLRGATLVDCRQIAFDRLVHLQFANCAGLGPDSRATLIAEIMGRHANLVLVDETNTILGCAKHVTIEVNRYRETFPGIEYTPPPTFHRLPPGEATAESIAQAASGQPDKALRGFVRGTLTGASDIFLDEVAARAHLDGDALLDDLPAGWQANLVRAAHDILDEAETAGAPGLLYADTDATAQADFAYPLVLQSNADLDTRLTTDISQALEELVHLKHVGRLIRERKDRLMGFAQRALKKSQGRERERRRALDQAEKAEVLRRTGELILANLHAIPPGAEQVQVVDYYEPEQPEVTLQLDANYSAKQNAKALFDRYKRAKRIQQRVPRLLRQARIQREYVQGILQQIQAAENLDELDQLEHELARAGHIGAQAARRRRPPAVGNVEPRRTVSADGYPVVFGRTGIQNDAIIRMANSEDVWLHVKNGPGGHVLIRTDGRPDEVPQSTIMQAAALAAFLSHWRSDARADVNYTAAKHLRKPKGAPPGFVTYTEFSTVTVEPADLTGEPPRVADDEPIH